MKQTLATAVILALVVPSAGARPVAAQQAQATLTILAGTVTVQPAGTAAFGPATDGMDLATGARVKTEAGTTALVTFVDGSTVTVQPETEITVERSGGGDQPSRTSIRITLGTVWARVVRLLGPQSEFSLQGQNAMATVRGTQIGAQQNADGSFVCWTRSGSMVVTDQGRSLTLQPGHATTVAAGQELAPRPFAVNASALRVTAGGDVLPLLATPAPERLAGFAGSGIEVNQVFGSFVSEGLAPRVVEIPAGAAGRYTLVVEGQRDGDVRLNLEGVYSGQVVLRRELAGSVRAGERLVADIAPQLDQVTDPRTALLLGWDVSDLRPLAGPPPGKLVLAPAEVSARAGGGPGRTGSPWTAGPSVWVLLALLSAGLALAARVARRP